jgi:hypothetical protein
MDIAMIPTWQGQGSKEEVVFVVHILVAVWWLSGYAQYIRVLIYFQVEWELSMWDHGDTYSFDPVCRHNWSMRW